MNIVSSLLRYARNDEEGLLGDDVSQGILPGPKFFSLIFLRSSRPKGVFT
jgi:hypothetical protein